MDHNKPDINHFEKYTESTFIKNENNFIDNDINNVLHFNQHGLDPIKKEAGDFAITCDSDIKHEPFPDIKYQESYTMTFTCTECDFSCTSAEMLEKHKLCHESETFAGIDYSNDNLNTDDFDFTPFYGDTDNVFGEEACTNPDAKNINFVSNKFSSSNFNSTCDHLNDTFDPKGNAPSTSIGIINDHVQSSYFKGLKTKKITKTDVSRTKINRERTGVRSENKFPIFVKRKDYDPTKDIVYVMSEDSTSSSDTGSSDSDSDDEHASSGGIYSFQEFTQRSLNSNHEILKDTTPDSIGNTRKLSHTMFAGLDDNTIMSNLRQTRPQHHDGFFVKELNSTSVIKSKVDRTGTPSDDSFDSAAHPTKRNTRHYKSQNHKELFEHKFSNNARTESEVVRNGLLSDEPCTSASNHNSIPVINALPQDLTEFDVMQDHSTSGTSSNLDRDERWLLSNKSITVTPIPKNSMIKNVQPRKYKGLDAKEAPHPSHISSKEYRIQTEEPYTSNVISTSRKHRNIQPQNYKRLNVKRLIVKQVPSTSSTGSNINRDQNLMLSNKPFTRTGIITNNTISQTSPKKNKRISMKKVPHTTTTTTSTVMELDTGKFGKISDKAFPILVKRKDYDPSRDIINVMSDDSSSTESECSDSDDGSNSSSNEGSMNNTEKQIDDDRINTIWIE